MRFKNKVALVTGAGWGIGRAIACRLAEEGADVAIHGRTMERLVGTADVARGLGRRAEVYQVEVSKVEEVREAIAKTIADFGKIDVLINNAGTNQYRNFFDFTDEEWNYLIGVNLTGVWNYCRYIGPHMIKQCGGSIVNVSSVAALTGHYLRSPYTAAKHGVNGLTKSLALELAESNVRVNGCAPGGVPTGMTNPTEKRFGMVTPAAILAQTPIRRWGRPEEIAAAVAFLASDDASYITGHILVVDGGYLAGTQIGMPWKPVPEEGYEVPWLTKLMASEKA